MKIVFPKAKIATPTISKHQHPIVKAIAITWHTVIPIILTYVSIRTGNPLWSVPIVAIMLVRIPEE